MTPVTLPKGWSIYHRLESFPDDFKKGYLEKLKRTNREEYENYLNYKKELIEYEKNLTEKDIKENKVRDLLWDCWDLFESKDYDKVLDNCEKALKIIPNEKSALDEKTKALYLLGDFNQSLTILNQAIELYPDDKEFWIRKAECLLELNRHDEVIKCCEDGLINLDGRCYKLCNYKILALLNLNKIKEAYKFFITLTWGNIFYDSDIKLFISKLEELEMFDEVINCYKHIDWDDDVDFVNDIKRFLNNHDLDIEPIYDQKFYISWINVIVKKFNTEICCECGGDLVQIIDGYPDLNSILKAREDKVILNGIPYFDDDEEEYKFECKKCKKRYHVPNHLLIMNYDDFDLEIYAWYMISKLDTYLKDNHISINELHDKMDYLDDNEFNEFIDHLKKLNIIYEPCEDYIKYVEGDYEGIFG